MARSGRGPSMQRSERWWRSGPGAGRGPAQGPAAARLVYKGVGGQPGPESNLTRPAFRLPAPCGRMAQAAGGCRRGLGRGFPGGAGMRSGLPAAGPAGHTRHPRRHRPRSSSRRRRRRRQHHSRGSDAAASRGGGLEAGGVGPAASVAADLVLVAGVAMD